MSKNTQKVRSTVPEDITEEPGPSNRRSPIFLDDAPTGADLKFWPDANKNVLWGWKRDVGNHMRTVYYSSDLCCEDEELRSVNHYFLYKHRTDPSAANAIHSTLRRAAPTIDDRIGHTDLSIEPSETSGFRTVTFTVGSPSDKDEARISDLLSRTPRDSIDNPAEIDTSELTEDALDFFPVDLYAGSGVSYEAGLPKLIGVHDWFCLDNYEEETFTHSDQDRLPEQLLANPVEKFRQFNDLHRQAIYTEPTFAQEVIADLWEADEITNVFTDNVDNIMSKLEVPFERTRGSGVLNEKHEADFDTDTLLVVGVAADRRSLIEQARNEGMDIVVVDPIDEVSLGVQHLSFVEKEDTFFKTTAKDFFRTARDTLL